MVTGNIDDARSLARLAQQLLHDVVMTLRPIPGFSQTPAVDDVTNKVEDLGLVVAQEVDEEIGLATARAEMNVRYPDRTITPADLIPRSAVFVQHEKNLAIYCVIYVMVAHISSNYFDVLSARNWAMRAAIKEMTQPERMRSARASTRSPTARPNMPPKR